MNDSFPLKFEFNKEKYKIKINLVLIQFSLNLATPINIIVFIEFKVSGSSVGF